jgi:hypothetical protein
MLHSDRLYGLHYKPITIVNDDSRVINKLETSLTDDARVVIYDHHLFIVQATGLTHKDLTRLDRFARDKHSSLLRKFAINGTKRFYNIGPSTTVVFFQRLKGIANLHQLNF